MKGNVLITGILGNLGSHVKEKLLDEEYIIYGTAGPADDLSQLKGEGVHGTQLDLTNEDEVQSYVAGIPGLTAGVLTVGGFDMGGFEDTSLINLKKMYSLNFETAYNVVRSLLPVFESKGEGHVILIGSRQALEPETATGVLAYAFSKRLVLYLADIVNAYGRGKNIRATVLIPSIIDTPQNREAMPDADFDKWVKPESIADTCSYLLSPSGQSVRETVIKLYNQT